MNRHQLELTGQSNSALYRRADIGVTARRASTGAVHYSRDRTIEAQNEASISGRYRTRGEGPRQYLWVGGNPGAHQNRRSSFWRSLLRPSTTISTVTAGT